MKKAFSRLLTVRELGMEDEEALEQQLEDVLTEDGLKDQLRARQRQGNKYISVAAKLLAPVIEPDTVGGFNWVVDMLRANSQQGLATEMEIATAFLYPGAQLTLSPFLALFFLTSNFLECLLSV